MLPLTSEKIRKPFHCKIHFKHSDEIRTIKDGQTQDETACKYCFSYQNQRTPVFCSPGIRGRGTLFL